MSQLGNSTTIMDFIGAESSSPPPPTVNYYCLLCRAKFTFFNQRKSSNSAANFEIFQDIFQVFSKYMGWDPPPEYKYNFHKDQFPFCGGCNLILIRIYKIHEDIQALEKQIEQFVLSATAKILDSERKILNSSTKEGYSDKCSADPDLKEIARPCDSSVRLDEREICHYYRGSISKRYSARVQLTIEDTKQLENYEAAVKLKTPEASEDFDQDYAHEGFISSPERSVDSDDDPTYVQEPEENAHNNEIQTAQDSGSASESNDEDSAEESDKVPEREVPRKQPFNTRIKELNPNEYLLDDKLPFVYQNPLWKCSACNFTALERTTLISHITSTRCSGLVHPNSAKELQHRGYIFDKIDDGSFVCRRCPFATNSKTSLVKHIDTSHCKPFQGSKKKRLLVKTLVKSASITQVRPDVFLINKEHEVEFKDNQFCCSACTFRTGFRRTVIRHVFDKHHGNNGMSMMAMSIQRIGPDKFKLGDFSFEAFPNEFKCTTCGHACARLRHMKIHIRSEHVKDMFKIVCEICGYSTFEKRAFNEHMIIHKDERPFLCPTCGKSFKSQPNLRTHEAGVHPTTPVVKSDLCEICGGKFKSKSLLTVHMKVHESVTCEICGKAYPALYLKKHLVSHNAEKKFECKHCGSKFQHSNSLRVHVMSCKGGKPYSCNLCGMKFTQHFSVTRHKNVAHNPEKTTKTCLRKGPAKQRRGQSLLTNKKSSAASGDRGSVPSNKAGNDATAADAAPQATQSYLPEALSLMLQ